VFRTGAAEVTPGSQTFELPEALGEMQWSPDGQQLAWVEGQDGAEANIHIWDAASREIVELPDETGYPSRLRWSPDGANIAYVAIESFLSDDGPTSNVIYIADTDGSSAAAADVSTDSQHLWLIDWIDTTSFVWSPFDRRAGALGLYLYDVKEHESTPLVDTDQPISVAAWDAISEILAFAVPVLDRSEEAPPQPGLSPGAYVIREAGQSPEQLLEADNLYGVDFTLPGYLAVGNDIVVRLDNNEQLLLSELRRVDYSPNGLYALGERSSQTFVRDLRSAEDDLVVQLYYLDGIWLDNQNFIAQVGAYGSVIGIGNVDGSFTNLVEDVGNGPFEGFITAIP
jgi:dipeptidyl aminopeptidase/acylaminoacyl peptidase